MNIIRNNESFQGSELEVDESTIPLDALTESSLGVGAIHYGGSSIGMYGRFINIILLAVLLASCTSRPPSPSPEVMPSATQTTYPTETSTAIPSPTNTAVPTEVPATSTATEIPEGMLTYKNAEGVEVTVELEKHKKGDLEVVQPPDRMAIVKLLADRSKWYPAGKDQNEVTGLILWDETFHTLLAKYGIPWPPKRIIISAYPTEAGTPFMPVAVTDWDGGTLVVGQGEDGSYFEVFYPGDLSEIEKLAYVQYNKEEYDYLHELADAHR